MTTLDLIRPALFAALLALGALSGCLSAETRRDGQALARFTADPLPLAPPAAETRPAAEDDRAVEAALAREVQPEVVLPLALARSPEVRAARARLRAALAEVPAAARPPDLQLQVELWGVPLVRPYAVHESEMIMAGLRQSFPPALEERARAALADARVQQATLAARASTVAARVRTASAELYRAERERAIHEEHLALAERLVEVARAGYAAGAGSQQQILALLLDGSRFRTQLAEAEAARTTAAAYLNTLLLRPPDAPLGPMAELAADLPPLDRPRLAALARERRPELAAARGAIERSQADLDVARSQASVPEFMVGLDYMVDPMMQTHFYGAMVSLSLPWLNPGRREAVEAAEHAVAAERAALEGAEAVVQFELHDAAARFDAARVALGIIERESLPRAGQSFDAARAEFLAGRADVVRVLDALRALWDVRLERVRTLARLHAALADVDRAVGAAGEPATPEPHQGDRE
jgi:outer membrane protein TolC